MSLSDFKKIVRKLPPDLSSFVISGGEPFVHEGLLDMVRFAGSYFARSPTVFTSGINGENDFFDLRDFVGFVQGFNVTVKNPSYDVNDGWFGTKGISEKSRAFLGRCDELGIPTSVHFGLDRENYGMLDRMLDFVRVTNSELHLLRFLPFGGSGREYWLDLSDELWECAARFASERGARVVFPSEVSYSVCQAGLTRLHVFVDGGVSGCIYLETEDYVVGNLLEDSLSSVLIGLRGWRGGFSKEGCISKKGLLP